MTPQSILPTPEIADNLLVDTEKIENSLATDTIRFTHGEKYLTSHCYTGSGEIAHKKDSRSFEVAATFTLTAEVKVVEGIF
ncbi:hypothetical protein [Sphaerospermopsis sp. LEGE 00249]|uniref:hypothetical protein n=1 Tax=Sphaerospermopsis sp. LEGE 00249 TaxID=1380707 RepID=UPI0021081FA8|nr:hypothetical protein [Sphaerospermopsis sp. LEGE 00249]